MSGMGKDALHTRRSIVSAAAVGALALAAGAIPGCMGGHARRSSDSGAEKTFVYGTTGYGLEMDDAGLDPHDAYSGWSAVRYGVGETLFRFSDAMEPEPWLAVSYAFVDETHCSIKLREGVSFSSGRVVDGAAVKECLEHLVAVHARAAADLRIKSIDADGLLVLIETTEPHPALVNYLCDPYCAIVDMRSSAADGLVSGTGPYRATAVSDTEVSLVRNDDYWAGAPKLDRVLVRSTTDGDTLAAALQTGEIDAAYGLPYVSYALFSDAGTYSVESCTASRTFFGQVNAASPVMQDAAVRRAVSLAIDREGFVRALLNGRGSAAAGPFPDNLAFGDGALLPVSYDLDGAKRLLEEAGWIDTDGDGIRERGGQRLFLRWLTYPGRMELPLLAEAAQASLREIGIDVAVNCTANHVQVRTDRDAWDVYVSALVTAPTGDPAYFFSTTCATGASANYGGYSNPSIDALIGRLSGAFDSGERATIAVEIQKMLLADASFFFVSHLIMGIVMRAGVTGLAPHPCDYYEITADLDVRAL